MLVVLMLMNELASTATLANFFDVGEVAFGICSTE